MFFLCVFPQRHELLQLLKLHRGVLVFVEIRKSKHEFSKVLPFFTDQERREYVNLKRRLDKIAEIAEAKKVRRDRKLQPNAVNICVF